MCRGDFVIVHDISAILQTYTASPANDGSDYNFLFPGSYSEHVCTIPDEELENGYTNPIERCYGRDMIVVPPLEYNPMGSCIKYYTDGMPSLGAMHYSHVDNRVSIPGESPYVPNKYCWVIASTRLGSGTNRPIPPIDAWSWNLIRQAREQLRSLIWAQS